MPSACAINQFCNNCSCSLLHMLVNRSYLPRPSPGDEATSVSGANPGAGCGTVLNPTVGTTNEG